METAIKSIYRRFVYGQRFREISSRNGLNIDFRINTDSFATFAGIFSDREYSDYFPFYKRATVLDIGAHYGYFSMFSSINLARDSNVIAVEPSSTNISILRRNIQDSGLQNIRVLHLAVSNTSGAIKLFNSASVNNSIMADPNCPDSSTYETVKSIKLEQIVNDNDLSKIDFLKMDCEGAEYEIFYGTPQHVLDRITTISMEFHDLKRSDSTVNDLSIFFKKSGFDVVKLKYSGTGLGLNYGKLVVTKMYLGL